MAANPNTQTTSDVVTSMDIEFVNSFQGEYDRFSQLVGLFPASTMAAGTALYQYKVTGSLLDGTDAKGSSGTSYTEGDFIARSKYKVTRTPIGEVEFVPYAKQTTAQAILKGGFEKAVMRTDRKAQQQIRAAIMSDFFALLGNGTTTVAPASGTYNLQQLLAFVDAKLGDVLETNDEETGDVVFFVNRQDAATYLGNATITTQNAFGVTYLESFLGVQNVILTNKVQSGTVYATPIENIHVYGLDFASLGNAGLNYETNDLGLVGVHHEADYNYGSAETFLVRGAKFVPEVTDFIVKGAMAPVVATTTTTTTGD